jgi:hypothetical protein
MKSIQLNSFNEPLQNLSPQNLRTNIKLSEPEYSPFYSRNENERDYRWEKKFLKSSLKGAPKRYGEEMDDESRLYTYEQRDDDSYIDLDNKDRTLYRLDDTINCPRRSNLSVEWSQPPMEDIVDQEFEEQLMAHYGKKLIATLELLFETNIKYGQYF